jgi:hypothetical protein
MMAATRCPTAPTIRQKRCVTETAEETRELLPEQGAYFIGRPYVFAKCPWDFQKAFN